MFSGRAWGGYTLPLTDMRMCTKFYFCQEFGDENGN